MKTKIIVSAALGLIIMIGLVSLVTIKLRHKKTDKSVNISSSTGQNNNMDQPQNTTNPITNPSNNNGSVTTLPTPEQFGQYNQYSEANSVVTIDSVVGSGVVAEAGKVITVGYKGWLTNGTMFDQSASNSPFKFTLGSHQVIEGWEQGFTGMKVGGKRRLVIPAALGYGARGSGPIPGGALLIFDVELIAVE